jgi:hypothetical protein
MTTRQSTSLLAAAGALLASLASWGTSQGAVPPDPLADELARWTARVGDTATGGDIWKQAKESAEPLLAEARDALAKGQRNLALFRLVSARQTLLAAEYVQGVTVRDPAGFEAEWTRMGTVLRDDVQKPAPDALADVRPAVVRALAEAVLPQVRIYYDASLEYGRNTMPVDGLFYIGAAQAARDLARFCRSLPAPPAGAAPSLRSIRPEIDGLRREVLAAYKPPVSIDKHREFITTSAALKEAAELDGLGLRYGALVRYLQAAVRFAPVPAITTGAGTVEDELRSQEARLAGGSVDHTIGRLFLEIGRAEAAKGTPEGAINARAVAADVLPRYFAALARAPQAPPVPAPGVTVTLVRWPYT